MGYKLFTTLFLFMFLPGCGSDTSSEGDNAAIEIPAVGAEENKHYQTLAITAQELQECLEENQNQLVYLIDKNVFKTCQDGEWVEIEALNSGNQLVVIAEEPIGDNCEAGGQKISTGIDSNKDNALSADEVKESKYVCNGKAGESIKGDTGLKGESGLKISRVFRYHTNTPTSNSNLDIYTENTIYSNSSSANGAIATIQVVEFEDKSIFVSVAGYVKSLDGSLDIAYSDFSNSFFLKYDSESNTYPEYIAKITPWSDDAIRYRINLESKYLKAVITDDNTFDDNFDVIHELTLEE